MICKECNTLNAKEAKFCETCGRKIKIKKLKFKVEKKDDRGIVKNLLLNRHTIKYVVSSALILFIVFFIVINIETINTIIPEAKNKFSLSENSIFSGLIPPKKQEKKKVEVEEVEEKVEIEKPKPKKMVKRKKSKYNSYTGMVNRDDKVIYGDDDKRMVLVPGQTVTIGDDNDPLANPKHKIKVDPFYMDVFEVTNIEFKRFLRETNYKSIESYPHFHNPRFNKDKQPMINVEYKDAKAYADWIGKRLPTEEEWECAAKGGKEYSYPTGENVNRRLANYGKKIKNGSTTIIGSYDPNPYGIYDLAGNVSEIVSGVLSPYSGNNTASITWGKRTSRGGSWLSQKRDLKNYIRRPLEVESEDIGTRGFRCVISKSALN
ncbi:MAG: hypothetical protein CR982_07145 [Candidatus Cloacimonadota bacterium]|nr:MAG: hypothetical protein CR982_07145 [Candidatus Cloacimonadota bacterium]PIE80626.1 MAG: hypothetical protein CSA15_01620 [Candidatus Delongbacteria bacterium]